MKRFLVLIFVLQNLTFAEEGKKLYLHGEPSHTEQALLELINRARVDPYKEAVLLDKLDTTYSRSARERRKKFFEDMLEQFESYPKAQPLSFHPALLDSAKKHSEDMMENGYLSHTNRKGKSPTDRGRLEGYKSGIVENLSGRAGETIEELLHTHYSLLIDYDNLKHSKKPFIHRLNILNPRYTEIGIGISGNYELGKVTENFGRSHEGTYILGVVYMDKNGNGIYDPGEGVEGVKVIPDYGEYYSITSKSGGYSIPININGEKKVEYPIELKGLKWTKEHKKVDEEFRILALEKEEFQEIQDVNVTFEGGILPSKIKKKISIHKPTKLDYKLVQEDGKTWGYHPESPLIVGKNYKLDLKLKTSGSTPKKEDSNIEYPR